MNNEMIRTLESICPECKDAMNNIIDNLPIEQNEVCVGYQSQHLSTIADEVVSAIEGQYTVSVMQFSHSMRYGHATRFVAIIDATQPINQPISLYFDHISKYSQIKDNLVVFLVNTDQVPSSTEVKKNIRLVLESKGISCGIITDKNEVSDALMSMVVTTSGIEEAAVKEIKTKILDAIDAKLAEAIRAKDRLLADKKAYERKAESINVYSNQLLLDTWLIIKRECEDNLEKDVREFAKQMMPILDKTVKEMQVSETQYFFSPYLNYLWGHFLTQEIANILASVKEQLAAQIDKLMATYQDFFKEQATVDDLDPVQIKSGSQPVSVDVEHYSYTWNKLFDAIVGNIIRFYLSYSAGIWGAFAAEFLTRLINKIIHPLLRYKYPDEEIKRRYSDAIFHQFYENVGPMSLQLKEYMIHALEHSFKDSLESIIEQMDANVKKIGERINSKIADIDNEISEIQTKIDLVLKNSKTK